MLIQQGTLSFPPYRKSGPQLIEQVLNFANPVDSIGVLLSGFDIMFIGHAAPGNADAYIDEHNVALIHADLRSRNLSAYSVEITGELGVRDDTMNWDDGYCGSLRYALIEMPEVILGGTLSFLREQGNMPRNSAETLQFQYDLNDNAAAISGFNILYPGRDVVDVVPGTPPTPLPPPPLAGKDTWIQEIMVDLVTQLPSPKQLQVSGSYSFRDVTPENDESEAWLRYIALGNTWNENHRLNFQIKTGRLNFPPHQGSGPAQSKLKIAFNQDIGNCASVLMGFSLNFEEGKDHPLHRAVIEVEARKLSPREVEVVGTLGLRDASGLWDDSYRGSIQFAVIAE